MPLLSTTAPPSKPQAWRWSCHKCQHSYPLGATRRCLNDGHYYCSGLTASTTYVHPSDRISPCNSAFDYTGWAEWIAWRRDEMQRRKDSRDQARKSTDTTSPTVNPTDDQAARQTQQIERGLSLNTTERKHNCFEDCRFPSECRWKLHPALISPVSSSAGSPSPLLPQLIRSVASLLGAGDDTLPSPTSPVSPDDDETPLRASLLNEPISPLSNYHKPSRSQGTKFESSSFGTAGHIASSTSQKRSSNRLNQKQLSLNPSAKMIRRRSYPGASDDEDDENCLTLGHHNLKLWDWSIGGLSTRGGTGGGLAGELDGGCR